MRVLLEKICTCSCHANPDVRHIVPCCGLTYKQYITADGTVDAEAFNKAIEEANDWTENEVKRVQDELFDIARAAERDMKAVQRLCEKALDNDELELHHFYNLLGDIGMVAAKCGDEIQEVKDRERKKQYKEYEERKAKREYDSNRKKVWKEAYDVAVVSLSNNVEDAIKVADMAVQAWENE